MKARILASLVGIVIVLAVGFRGLAAEQAKENTASVKIHDDCITLTGSSISQADRDKVLAILKKYNKQSYKIQPYEKGKPLQPIGTMDTTATQSEDEAFAKTARAKGLSYWSHRIHCSREISVLQAPYALPPSQRHAKQAGEMRYNADNVQAPSASPPSQRHAKQAGEMRYNADNLVAKLKPVLQKYSK
jgi:hypothetical protein